MHVSASGLISHHPASPPHQLAVVCFPPEPHLFPPGTVAARWFEKADGPTVGSFIATFSTGESSLTESDGVVARDELVYCETGTAVDTVLFGSRVVVQGGRVLTVDEAALREKVQAVPSV